MNRQIRQSFRSFVLYGNLLDGIDMDDLFD